MDKTYTALNGTIYVHDGGVDVKVTSRAEQLNYNEIEKVKYSKATSKNEGTLDLLIKNKNGIRLKFTEKDNVVFKEAEAMILDKCKNKPLKIVPVITASPVKIDDPDLIKAYSVLYLGGVIQNPKKTYNIELSIFKDRFEITYKLNDKSKFQDIVVPYDTVINFEIVERNVTSIEGLLGGINSRQLNQNNNIHITCINDNENERIIRLEMITGTTVMGQAVVCRELLDILRTNNILSIFKSSKELLTGKIKKGDDSYIDELKNLANLRDDGIITQEEFEAKKKKLLGL